MLKARRVECFFPKTSVKLIGYLSDKLKSAISEIDIPQEYEVTVHADPFRCLTLEVEGPNEEKIESIHLKAASKLIEICEKENIEEHLCGSLDICIRAQEPDFIEGLKKEMEVDNSQLQGLFNGLANENTGVKDRLAKLELEITHLKKRLKKSTD